MSLHTAEAQDAVRKSIATEKHAMDFYRYGATKLQDQAARKLFEILAQEERAHAGSFYRIYTGTDIPSLEAYLDAPPAHESEWLAGINKQIKAEFNEKSALELAMQKEQSLEEALRNLVGLVTDPTIKTVYEMNATETHNHYLQIAAEYSRIMGMVDETDMDTYVRE
jgi:rubrerythrin